MAADRPRAAAVRRRALPARVARWAWVPLALGAACGPAEEPAGAAGSAGASGAGGSAGAGPRGPVRFGGACSTALGCLEGECRRVVGPNESGELCSLGTCQGVCSRTCAAAADCPDTAYCATTPLGAMCLPRCETNADCPRPTTCGRAGAVPVCWDPAQPGGDVRFAPRFEFRGLLLGDTVPTRNERASCGVWRLVPGVPLRLQVLIDNAGSFGGSFVASLRADNPWVQVTAAQGALAAVTRPGAADPSYAVGPFEVTAREGIPLGVPQPMVLDLVSETGIDQYSVAFALTSFRHTALVDLQGIGASPLRNFTGNFQDQGYLVTVQGGVRGAGGFIVTGGAITTPGVTTLPVPAEVMDSYYRDPLWENEAFFGAPDPWLFGGGGPLHAVYWPFVIDALPADGFLSVELHERAGDPISATLPVTVY